MIAKTKLAVRLLLCAYSRSVFALQMKIQKKNQIVKNGDDS